MKGIESKEYSQEEVIMFDSTCSEEEINNDSEVTEEEKVTQNATEKVVECTETPKGNEFDPIEEQSETKTVEDKIDVISHSLSELSNKVDQMNSLFLQKIAHTTHEEQIVDQMHAELQKYKQDMYAQLVRPILLDIIEIRDSILRMSANYEAKPEGEKSIPLKTFSDYAYDVQDILEKNNVTIYDSKEGDVFSPIKQKAIKKVTTPVEELHGKIAESLSSGYEYLGKPISPEKVVVYVYQKIVNEEGDTNNG